MPENTTKPEQKSPVGAVIVPPIETQAWLKALAVYRPARYSDLAEMLEYMFDRLHIVQLWKNLIGPELPKNWNTYDLQCDLAGRVYRDMFPLSLGDMDMVYNSGGNPFAGPILFDGHGIPWDVCSLDEIHPAALVAMKVVFPFLPFDEETSDAIDVLWDGLIFALESADVSSEMLPIDRTAGRERLDRLEKTLNEQPTPWPGVAGLFHGILRDTGNPFIDWPSTWHQGEYMDCWSDWFWTTESIRELADTYNKVRPMYEAIDALYKWCDETPNAPEKIAAHLAEILTALDMETMLDAGKPLIEVLTNQTDKGDTPCQTLSRF